MRGIPFGNGKTVVRGGVGIYYDQPVTNIVTPMGSNPPFSQSVNITQNINLAAPFNSPPGVGSALQVVDPNFKSGRVLSYNLNVQQEFFGTVFQTRLCRQPGPAPADHRRLQPGHRRKAAASPHFDRSTPFGNPFTAAGGAMTIQESMSNSNYNGMWLSAEKRLAKGLTFNASYTFSKSIDNNSVGSSNPQMQNFYNIAAERALSDFDARQRFVLSGIYLLPFKWDANGFTSRVAEGWSISPIVNLQSGNPFSPIVPTADPNSLETFDRPNVVLGQPLTVANPSPVQWLNKAAFVLNTPGVFGNAGRNILTSPRIRRHRFRDLEDHGDQGAHVAAIPRRGVQSVQSSELRTAGEQLHGGELRPDPGDPHRPRRSGQFAAAPTRDEVHFLAGSRATQAQHRKDVDWKVWP